MEYSEVLQFWFGEIDKSSWFKKDHALDSEIKKRFGQIHIPGSSF